MKTLMKILTVVLLVAGMGLCPTTARADFTVFLGHEFSGATAPSGSGPWLRADIDQNGTNKVRFTLTTLLTSSSEFVSKWAFNLDPSLNAASLGVAAFDVADITGLGLTLDTDGFKADGDGDFDILFEFGNGDFTKDESIILDFTLAGLVAEDFEFPSVDGPDGKTGFVSAAHVQGIDDPGCAADDPFCESGWIAGGTDVVPIPAPGALVLAAMGIGLVGAVRRRLS